MKHCIRALHSHSFRWNILLIIPFYLLFGAFLLVATKYCFPPVFVSCFSWILWAYDVFGRTHTKDDEAKLTLYCILMWTKKLNGKVPRKRFPKDPMPKREMDSIQSHNKENGKTSNFFFDALWFCLRLCFTYSFCLAFIGSRFLNWNFITFLHSHLTCWILWLDQMCARQSNHERTNTMFAANIKWKWNSIIVYIRKRVHCTLWRYFSILREFRYTFYNLN